jgi:putative DNA primase/helicase
MRHVRPRRGFTRRDGVSLGQAFKFLRLLDSRFSAFTFQTFAEKGADSSNVIPRVIHLRDRTLDELIREHDAGAGVYVVANKTDGAGRKSENIVRVRAVWQEDDDGFAGIFPLEPSIIVETSAGHFHRYWLVADEWAADEQGRVDFAGVMERMVDTYGSDKGAKDISRVLRLPGFLHRKADKGPVTPHMIRLVQASGKRYTRAEILAAFPPVDREKIQAPAKEWQPRGDDDQRIREALDHINADDRDAWCQIGMALKDYYGDSGRPLWDAWSRRSDKFNERDQDKTWRSFRRNGIGIGTLFHHAKQAGWNSGISAALQEPHRPLAECPPNAGGTHHDKIAALAKLPTLEYGLARQAAAAEIGVRVSTLDAAVKEQRKLIKNDDDTPATWAIEAAPEPAVGGLLLDAIKSIFEKYVVLPPHSAVAISLWVMHTWTLDAADISAILGLISPEKRCGKTTVLKLLNRLARRASLASNISTPALFRYIEAEQPTLLIDEADSFLKDNEEMRGVLNSGHSREAAFVIRCEGEDMKPKKFSTWGPKAIAAIKKLPTTLTDRSITVPMRRKLKTEKRPRYRDRDTTEFQIIRSQALRWANDNEKSLADDPAVPDALDDRAADNWRPLLAIAERAGGEWPEEARKAALALSGVVADDTTGVRLLRDIRWIFDGKPKADATGKTATEYEPVSQLPSKELVTHLIEIEDSPWADWPKKGFTQTALADLLEPYRIASENIRVGDKVPKGYKAARFKEAFDAYLGDNNACQPLEGGDSAATTLQPNKNGHNSQNLAATVRFDVAAEKAQKPAPNGHCSGVAVKNPPGGENGVFGRSDIDAACEELAARDQPGSHGHGSNKSDGTGTVIEPTEGEIITNGEAKEIRQPAISSGPDDNLDDFTIV